MDNVYCEKCTFCKEREWLWYFHDDVKFKDEGRLGWREDVCIYDADVKVITITNSRTTYKRKQIRVDELTRFNKNNKCKHYKKKWWLLWMK